MNEPTKEQWLWEQCGLHLETTVFHDKQAGAEFIGVDIERRIWRDADGNLVSTIIDPPIDLNNLFKYEPLTAKGYHIKTDSYKREVAGVMGQCSWVEITDPEGTVVSCFAMQELKDALFWAIYTAFGGE